MNYNKNQSHTTNFINITCCVCDSPQIIMYSSLFFLSILPPVHKYAPPNSHTRHARIRQLPYVDVAAELIDETFDRAAGTVPTDSSRIASLESAHITLYL